MANRQIRHARTQRQPTSWGRLVSPTYTTVPANSKVILASVALSNPGIGETVRRTRGWFSAITDQSAALEDVLGAIGFAVVTDLAFAAGAASIPGPVTDASDDGWFVWEGFANRQDGNIGIVAGHQFDSKAMRRIEEGSIVVMMGENAHATFGMDIGFAFSILSSLS